MSDIDFNKRVNLIQRDCLEIIKQIPNKSIDLILTDPPYGDNQAYGRLGKEIINNENPLINCQVLNDCYRILKDNTVCYNFTNWKHYPFLKNYIENYTNFKIRHLIVWNKPNIGMGYGFRNKYELILVLEKGNPSYYYNDFANVQDSEWFGQDKDKHPHIKPIELLNKLITHVTNIDDIVLDCFMGSGTTGVAALQSKRKFIGIELDNHWFDYAKEKIDLIKTQQTLGGF